MSKTTEKNTKTTKTSKTAKTSSKNPQTKTTKTTTQPTSFSFIKTVQAPVELFKDVTTKSIYFSLGLGALLLDGRQNLETIQNFKFDSLRNTFSSDLRKNVNSFINSTINKGEKFEKDATNTLKSFEKTQRDRVKEFFTTPKPKIQTQNTIEEKIEEVIANLDLPTRDELQQLNRRLSEISRQLSTQKGVNRKAKAVKTEPKAENEVTVKENQTVETANV